MRIRHISAFFLCAALAGCNTLVNREAGSASMNSMVLVPAGEFPMGTDAKDDPTLWRDAHALNPYGFRDETYANEHPAHKVTLPAFLIDKYEVSNAQYRDFVISAQHRLPGKWAQNGYIYSSKRLQSLPLEELRRVASDLFKLDMDVTAMGKKQLVAELEKINAARDSQRVISVTWADAQDYCIWAGKRLPKETEWDKAARGPQGYNFPWGNEWDPKKVNTMSDNPDAPYSSAGSAPDDRSVYGVYDMAGNVAEWVSDWYDAYPGASTSSNKEYGKSQRVVRGGMASAGHYDSLSELFRSSRRSHHPPDTTWIDIGFRCAKDAE